MTQDQNRPLAAVSTARSAPPRSARDVEVETSALPDRDVISGRPCAGSRTVRTLGDVEVGIWDMTPGSARDVEADEVFVVLAGAATIQFDDGREISLQPGDVMSLSHGERTVWTVTETLRKVYVLHADERVDD